MAACPAAELGTEGPHLLLVGVLPSCPAAGQAPAPCRGAPVVPGSCGAPVDPALPCSQRGSASLCLPLPPLPPTAQPHRDGGRG